MSDRSISGTNLYAQRVIGTLFVKEFIVGITKSGVRIVDGFSVCMVWASMFYRMVFYYGHR